MLEKLKESVYKANIELVNQGLVIYTWGNVSGISEDRRFMVIKPSGIKYESMEADDMVVVEISTGKVVEGRWNPSSDTPTHLELYRSFPEIGAVAHTHSTNAVAFAQAGREIPVLGTTQADYFWGNIPCTRALEQIEIYNEYEKNTGIVIAETINQLGYNPLDIPGILVRNHGPFTWGKSPEDAVYHAKVLEAVADMTLKTLMLNPSSQISSHLVNKHYQRKNGVEAYYGQGMVG